MHTYILLQTPDSALSDGQVIHKLLHIDEVTLPLFQLVQYTLIQSSVERLRESCVCVWEGVMNYIGTDHYPQIMQTCSMRELCTWYIEKGPNVQYN